MLMEPNNSLFRDAAFAFASFPVLRLLFCRGSSKSDSGPDSCDGLARGLLSRAVARRARDDAPVGFLDRDVSADRGAIVLMGISES